ncbi:MAG TPA: hypothetical protein VM537_23875 [Anaerolineae bacterium]|nr:hypothetical protein [Anaerolineae bacterium]
MDDYSLRLVVSAKACERFHTWAEIGKVVGLSQHTVRVKFYHDAEDAIPMACPICYGDPRNITGAVGPQVEFEIDGNYAVATSEDGRIRTLPDLLAACRADLSVWKIRDRDGWEVKGWEGYAANEIKNLIFDEGRITGTVFRDGIITETLWSVRAVFVRRKPEPLHPAISPVLCPISYTAPGRDTHKLTEGTAGLLADPHYGYSWKPPKWRLRPFHDRDVLDLFLQVMADLQPEVIELLGDWFDLAVFQPKFIRRPEYYQTTQPAILEAHRYLRRLRETCPDSDIRLHMGNHDERIETAMIEHLREACELKAADELELPPAMSVPRLLALHELGIEWVPGYPNDVTWLGQAMQCQHGCVARAKEFATVAEILKQGEHCHQATGHIHRDEMVSALLASPTGDLRTITGYCPGCACHVDGRVPAVRTKLKWRKGFGVVPWHGQHVSIEHVPVWDRKAVWRGKVYEARDTVPGLKQDLPDWPW